MKHQLSKNRGKKQNQKRMKKERWGSERDAPQAWLNTGHAEFKAHVQYAGTAVQAPLTYSAAPLYAREWPLD